MFCLVVSAVLVCFALPFVLACFSFMVSFVFGCRSREVSLCWFILGFSFVICILFH